MKTNKFFALVAVAALALVSCKKEDPTPVFEPSLSVDKTEKIVAPAEGTTATVKVTANITWTATASQDWVSVNPASKSITDKKSVATNLTVTIPANEAFEARTATVTLKAEGCKDIVLNIEQNAAEKPEPVFEALDDEGNPITAPYSITFVGGTISLYLNSNVSWTATSSDESWLNVDPASYTSESSEVIPTSVTLEADTNTTTEARSATVTFKAEGLADIVITVNQAEGVTLSISVANITYQTADVTFTPSNDNAKYHKVLTTDSNWQQMQRAGYSAADAVKYFLHQNAVNYEMSDAEYFSYVYSQGAKTVNYSGLPDKTKLIALACFLDDEAEIVSDGAIAEFTTAEKPVADPAYTALLGTYSYSAYDYFEDTPVSGTLVVEEGVANESYLISLPGGWGPEDGSYIDHFECPWDKEGKKSFALVDGTQGDMGLGWNLGSLGVCGLTLDMFYWDSYDVFTAIVLTADESGNLSATSPAVPQGDYLCLQSGLYNEEGSTGYAYGIYVFTGGMKFTKTSASVKKGAGVEFFSSQDKARLAKVYKARKAVK